MCYDIKTMKRSQLKKAKHFGDDKQVKELEKELEQLELLDIHHSSGFDHPQLSIITNDKEKPFKIASWGFIPSWAKTLEDGKQFWNKTLNARSEEMFEKNAYQSSAKNKRCLIVVDGFYEHHHYAGKTYPFFIHAQEPILLAGLWNEIKTPDGAMVTFSICTTKGNSLLKKIHNNPKMNQARMPVILNDELGKKYIEIDANDKAGKDEVLELCQPNNIQLTAYPVHALRGKYGTGNKPVASEEWLYLELDYKTLIE
ncbi:MAG: SOS response-associated peptidase [Chitinophagales bacterium]